MHRALMFLTALLLAGCATSPAAPVAAPQTTQTAPATIEGFGGSEPQLLGTLPK